MPYRFILLVALLVSGCNKEAPEKPSKSMAQRQAAVKAKINSGPEHRAHKIGNSELLVVDIPAPGPMGLLVENQRCYVWRDAEYRTSTLSCPHQPEVSIADDGRDAGMVDNAN